MMTNHTSDTSNPRFPRRTPMRNSKLSLAEGADLNLNITAAGVVDREFVNMKSMIDRSIDRIDRSIELIDRATDRSSNSSSDRID